MADRIPKNTWVEIYSIVLTPGERAPRVPEDTRQVPLEMKVKGFLEEDAAIGEHVSILTPAGRNLHGTLTEANPAYTHDFGPPIPELMPIGMELKAILSREVEK